MPTQCISSCFSLHWFKLVHWLLQQCTAPISLAVFKNCWLAGFSYLINATTIASCRPPCGLYRHHGRIGSHVGRGQELFWGRFEMFIECVPRFCNLHTICSTTAFSQLKFSTKTEVGANHQCIDWLNNRVQRSSSTVIPNNEKYLLIFLQCFNIFGSRSRLWAGGTCPHCPRDIPTLTATGR